MMEIKKEEKLIDCYTCKKRRYCMGYMSQIFDMLKRLGVEDFSLKILLCINYEKGGDGKEFHGEGGVKDSIGLHL